MSTTDFASVDPEVIELAAETLSGDLRDAILDRLRHASTPWWQMPEADQRATAVEIGEVAERLVRQTVTLVAAGGRKMIRARLKKAVRKEEEIEGTVTLTIFDEQRHEFMDAVGSPLLIVVAEPEAFIGERAAPAVDPDQSALPLE